MKNLLFVYSLPFHKWMMASLKAYVEMIGFQVTELEHTPIHPHDWISQRNIQFPSGRFHAVFVADYPYGWIRKHTDAPIIATRHSLANRGNTYEPEQNEADYLLSFGKWDEEILKQKSVCPKKKIVQTGAIWIDDFLYDAPLHPAAEPYLAWVPTWNHFDDPMEVLSCLLENYPGKIWLRPHYATAWRHPDLLHKLQRMSPRVAIHDPLESPVSFLQNADMVVGDVSGILLMAPLACRPVIQIAPPPGIRSAQLTPDGPEWWFRNEIGSNGPLSELPKMMKNPRPTDKNWAKKFYQANLLSPAKANVVSFLAKELGLSISVQLYQRTGRFYGHTYENLG